MSNLGDYYSGCSIFDVFTTVDTQGRPSPLSGTPVPFLVVYKDAFAIGGYCTVIGAVIALNCNGLSGVNAWSVNTNQSPTFYACGHDYQVLLIGGCVDSLCVSGYVVGRFSLKNRAGLKPTIHGLDLDVSATGEAGVDWGNVGSPTTAVGLSCTTLFSITSIANSVGVSGRVKAEVEQWCGAYVTALETSGQLACTIWNQLKASYGTCGTFGDLLDCKISTRLGPTVPGRPLDVTATGAAGIDWGNVENPATANALACTTLFSVKSVLNSVAVDACAAIFRVETLSNTATSSILDAAITEPASVFAWAGATVRNILGWIGAVSSNRLTQTATQQSLCDRGLTVTIASAPVDDDGTTARRGSFS